MSSDAHRWDPLELDDFNRERSFSGLKVYGQSKIAILLLTHAFAKRSQDSGVTVNALHLGAIASRLGRDTGTLAGLLQRFVGSVLLQRHQGAETSVFVATAPALNGVTGCYLVKKKKEQAPEPFAIDDDSARRLGALSKGAYGVSVSAVGVCEVSGGRWLNVR